MKNKRRAATCFGIAALMLSCLAPPAGVAEERIATMSEMQLEGEAREGALLPLEPLGDGTAAVVDGVVYGYGIKRFHTFFEVGDASLYEAVGLTPPRGTVTWDEFMDMADAVQAYNRQNAEAVWLLAVQAQRFPPNFSLMKESGVGNGGTPWRVSSAWKGRMRTACC